MNAERVGHNHIVTDDVSGRVVAVPHALTTGMNPVYELRRFLQHALMHPEQVPGAYLVSEGPHGMTPMEMRTLVPNHLWHPEVVHHPTGGPSDVHPARERHRLALLHKARTVGLDDRERTIEHFHSLTRES